MKIVVVDNSRVNLKILTTMLEDHGHSVVSFLDATEALTYIRCEQDVDVVLTGLELSPISGFELCWDTRLLVSRGRQIYILAMSSSTEDSKLIETLDSGADDFIRKPPNLQELLARLRVAERMKYMQEELIKLATLDCLTGILNRRAFFDASVAHCTAADDGADLSAIMFDIDHFKRVNDNYGHDIGDKALVAVVGTVEREFGLFARMGGEEFALLLPKAGKEEALVVAEKLRAEVEALDIEAEGYSKPLKLTCSFGVSEWAKGDSIESLLKRSDLGLYLAKESGRNQVQFNKHTTNDFIPERSEVIEIVELDPNVVELNS